MDEARKHFVQAVDYQRTVSKGRGDLWLAKALNEQAEFEEEQGNSVAALDCFDETIRIVDNALDEPDPSFARILVQAAHLASSAGRQKDAERWYRRALALTRKQTGPDSARAAALMDNLALVLAGSGRVSEAEKLHREAHEIFENVKDECPEDIAVNQLGLGAFVAAGGSARRGSRSRLIDTRRFYI